MSAIEFLLEGDPLVPTDSPIDYMVGFDSMIGAESPENASKSPPISVNNTCPSSAPQTAESKNVAPVLNAVSSVFSVVEYTAILFEKYYYRHFTVSDSRVKCLEKKAILTPVKWGAFIDRLVKNKILSVLPRPREKTLYRFNLPCSTGVLGVISFEYVMKILMTNYIGIPIVPILFTAEESIDKLHVNCRPRFVDWKIYLECLVKDGYLEITEYSGINRYRYSLCNKVKLN